MPKPFAESLSGAEPISFISKPSPPNTLNHQENAPFVYNALGGYNHIGKAAAEMFKREKPKVAKPTIPSDIVPR